MITPILFTALQSSIPQPIALLDDGTHLLVLDQVEVGSYLVQTPYGVLRSEGQRVVELSDSAEEIALLAPLRDLDYATWIVRLSERGLLDRLVNEPLTDANRDLLLPVLLAWGKRLDPLPPSIAGKDRITLMWQELMEAEDGRRALLLGAIEREIAIDPTDPRHQLELSSWHAAIDHDHALLRWAAVRVAALQRDPAMAEPLLANSLRDKELWTAMASARVLLQVESEGGLLRLAIEVGKHGRSWSTRRAALLLGTLAPEHAVQLRSLIEKLRYFSLQGESRCGTAPAGSLGLPVTEASALDTEIASSLERLQVADILEKASNPGQQVDPSALDAQELPSDPEEALGEAWRKHLMER